MYIVGGFVRDLIMERPSLDFDVVVEGDAIALGRRLASQFGGRVVTHSRFGTAKWWIADVRPQLANQINPNQEINLADLPESLDLIGARTEFYDYPTALPTVERSSIKLDLHRRDFTINTMALRLDGRHYGELYDYWGGMNDVRHGLVRVLHSLSFVDDPTRMLRAVRFEQRFGFQIETRTRQLMDEARPLLRQVTGERLRHELELALSEEHPALLLARFQNLELLAAIHPHLAWQASLAGPLEAALLGRLDPAWSLPEKVGHTPIRRALGLLIWLGSLPAASAVEIANCLRLPGHLIAPLRSLFPLCQALPSLVSAPPSQAVGVLEEMPLISLYSARLLNLSFEINLLLDKFILEWHTIFPATNGDDLRALGIPSGPIYHTILDTLRAAWLDGKINNIEEETLLLQALIVKKNG